MGPIAIRAGARIHRLLRVLAFALLAADVPWAALVPIVVLLVGFQLYCLIDLMRSETQHLPKWAWALVIALGSPIGGIVYLATGRRYV